MVQKIGAILVGHIEVHVTVAVVVCRGYAFVKAVRSMPRMRRSLRNVPSPLLWNNLRRAILVGDEEIEIPVIVDVGPRSSLGWKSMLHPARWRR